MATTHGGTAGDELILPVNAYDFTVPERNRLGWARQVLVGACLRRLGFGYDAATTTAQYKRLAAIDLADHGVYENKRRYVVTDPATAGKYGYHLVSTVTGAQATAGRRDPHGPGATNVAEREALIGVGLSGKPVTHTADGRPVPAGGCVGAANATLSRSGSVGEAKSVSRLDGTSYKQSLHDAKVVAAFGAWSRCMADRGYHIADPVKASDGFNPGLRRSGDLGLIVRFGWLGWG
jgi:hypothetical protein